MFILELELLHHQELCYTWAPLEFFQGEGKHFCVFQGVQRHHKGSKTPKRIQNLKSIPLKIQSLKSRGLAPMLPDLPGTPMM